MPANTESLARIPCADSAALREGGVPLEQADGVRVIGGEAGITNCVLSAGHYRFSGWVD